MLVCLGTLEIDSTLWKDLYTLSGEVRHWYYHEVHGMPIDFGGNIGGREVRVCDYIADNSRNGAGSTQPTLNFGEGIHRMRCSVEWRLQTATVITLIGKEHSKTAKNCRCQIPRLFTKLLDDNAIHDLGFSNKDKDTAEWNFDCL